MTAQVTPITDLDQINSNWTNADQATGIFQSDEIYIDADNKTFYFKGAGNLTAAGTGVTGQALYSFFKDRWKNDPFLPQYEFPMLSITNEQFEFINGWRPDDTVAVLQDDLGTDDFSTTTRKLIRTAGWSEVEVNGEVSRRYFGAVSLGTLGDADQPYYVQDASFSAATADTEFTGPVNEAIQFYGNIATTVPDTVADDFAGTASGTATTTSFTASTRTIVATGHGLSEGDVVEVTGSTNNNGFLIVDTVVDANTITVKEALVDETVGATLTHVGFDRSEYYKIFVRTRGKTYADADLADIGVSDLTYIVYRFPVTNSTDLNINTTDDAAFTGATITSISGDGTTVTVDTSGAHGLYTGAPVTISGTTNHNGTYTPITVTDANTFTFSSAITNAEVAGTTKLGYVDVMSIVYLANPDTATGDVVIRGDYADGVTYALGDVVYDNPTNGGDGNYYYVDANAGTSVAGNGTIAGDASTITWTQWTEGVRDIEEDGTNSAYTAIFELNAGTGSPGATKEPAYEYAQYLLRQASNINDLDALYAPTSSDRNGNIADPLVFFVGPTLNTYSDSTIPFAVVLDDIADSDVNNVQYNDFAGVSHFAPTVVQVTINFNNNLSGDADAVFYAYYTTGEGAETGNDYGSPGAIQVQKVSGGVSNTVGSDVGNDVPASGTYSFNYAYTADATNGRATGGSATDVNITIVALGLSTGQYVSTSGNITDTGATFSLVAPLERNYVNPA